MILSDGDAAIGATLDNALHATGIAALLDNRSATIDITGTLNITTTTLNNIRENVHIAHAPDVVTEARLEQPHWRKNQPNGGSGDFRLSSNYDAHEIYYLNPADILKDEPYITPDGQQIRRAIVRLTPRPAPTFMPVAASMPAKPNTAAWTSPLAPATASCCTTPTVRTNSPTPTTVPPPQPMTAPSSA